MKRKQIYLPPEMDRQLADAAAKEGVSQAELIRRALDQYLAQHNAKRPRNVDNQIKNDDPVLQLIGLAEAPGKEGSITLDADLYGDDIL